MYKTFKELGFKVGDVVKCVFSDDYDLYRAGFNYTLTGNWKGDPVIAHNKDGSKGQWELVMDEYEDKWELNDGTVEVPDDADKLEKNGSVVAFRRKKRRKFKRGDKVIVTKIGHVKGVVVEDQENGLVLVASGLQSYYRHAENITLEEDQ